MDPAEENGATQPSPPPGLGEWLAGWRDIDRPTAYAFCWVMGIAAALILPYLGSIGFYDPWETHYAEVCRQMVVRDDYLYPFWKNTYFFSKPVLIFWLSAIGFKLIGAGVIEGTLPMGVEWVGRLPCALFSLAAVATLFVTVRRLWNLRTAIFSCVCLSLGPEVVICRGVHAVIRTGE